MTSRRPSPSDMPARRVFTPQERVLIRTIDILRNIDEPSLDDIEFAEMIARSQESA